MIFLSVQYRSSVQRLLLIKRDLRPLSDSFDSKRGLNNFHKQAHRFGSDLYALIVSNLLIRLTKKWKFLYYELIFVRTLRAGGNFSLPLPHPNWYWKARAAPGSSLAACLPIAIQVRPRPRKAIIKSGDRLRASL